VVLARPLLSIDIMSPDSDDRQPAECSADAEDLRPDLVTIRGIVLPIDWDRKGNVAAMAVSTYDEDEYLVEKDENGAALEAFMRKEVEVVGIVREAGGRQIITVKGMQPRSGHHAPEKNGNGRSCL
jgi:hypothetical protein